MKKNFRKYVLWAAVASFLGMILLDTGIISDLGRYEAYVEKIMYILVIAGIINKGEGK